MTDDRYARFDYSRLINWGDRLPREWKFLEGVLATAPARSILDLGSGTGEHARFLASKGYEVVGLDSSAAMLEKARASTSGDNPKFVEGDMRDAASVVDRQFGAALCLGNALPHLAEADDLYRLAATLRRVVMPGGVFIAQWINYDRYERTNERALPLSFLPDPDDPQAKIVFLRTMDLQDDGRVVFMPTILKQRPDQDPPIQLVASQRVEIRGWRRTQFEDVLFAAGFTSVEVWGSYAKAPFDPAESRDVILVAR